MLAPRPRCDALPILEGAMKRVHILIAQQIGHFFETRVRGRKKLAGELLSRSREQNAERRAFFRDTTLQGTFAHAQVTCDLRELRATTGQTPLQYDVNLVTDRPQSRNLRERRCQCRREQPM